MERLASASTAARVSAVLATVHATAILVASAFGLAAGLRVSDRVTVWISLAQFLIVGLLVAGALSLLLTGGRMVLLSGVAAQYVVVVCWVLFAPDLGLTAGGATPAGLGTGPAVIPLVIGLFSAMFALLAITPQDLARGSRASDVEIVVPHRPFVGRPARALDSDYDDTAARSR